MFLERLEESSIEERDSIIPAVAGKLEEINVIKTDLKEVDIETYVADFEKSVQEHSIGIGSISVEEAQAEEVPEEDDGKCLGFTQFGRGFPGSLKQKGIHLPKRISAR